MTCNHSVAVGNLNTIGMTFLILELAVITIIMKALEEIGNTVNPVLLSPLLAPCVVQTALRLSNIQTRIIYISTLDYNNCTATSIKVTQFFQTELMVEICSESLVRAITKVLLMKFS